MNTLLCPIWRHVRHGRRDRAADGGRIGRGVSRCIRHAAVGAPQAIGPLPVTVIETAVRVLLVAAGRRAPLLATRLEAATVRAVLLATVAGPADPKRRATFRSRATSLMENDFCVLRHLVPTAGLDRTGRSWQGKLHVGTWRSLTGPTHKTPVASNGRGFLSPPRPGTIPHSPQTPARLRRG
jgi:hypothetical protein